MGKVIVITGGSSGLGKATAQILSAKNKVIILARNKKEVVETAKELNCDGLVCDVTDEKQIQQSFSEIIEKYKKIDCLINCAGVWLKGPIEENSPEDIKNTILINTVGTILMVNSFVPQFKKQKSGRIINIISQAGLDKKADRSVYYASKWGVTGFTKCLQMELAPHDISVVGFYPGFMETPIFSTAGETRSDFSNALPPQKAAQAIAFLVDVDADVVIKEFGIESIKSGRK